jgi:group I intron endonuclease
MGVIYKINFPDGKAYIGSTTTPLNIRMNHHFSIAKSWPASSLVTTAIAVFGRKNITVDVLDEIENKDDLRVKERMLIEEHDTLYPNGYNKTIQTGKLNGVFKSKTEIKPYRNDARTRAALRHLVRKGSKLRTSIDFDIYV